MTTETFAGTHIAFCAAVPATYTVAGYAALAWTDACAAENVPPVKRKYNAVEESSLCTSSKKDLKGTSKYEPVAMVIKSNWGDPAQVLLETAEESAAAVISVKIEFQGGDIAYFTAQVAMFALTNGGSGDDLNKRDLELWIQSNTITRDPA